MKWYSQKWSHSSWKRFFPSSHQSQRTHFLPWSIFWYKWHHKWSFILITGHWKLLWLHRPRWWLTLFSSLFICRTYLNKLWVQRDDGELQTLHLHDCLYVPSCSVRLLCPRQIGDTTKHCGDGFNASKNPILTVHGKKTTLQYDNLSKLPLLFTAPGITSYQPYLSNFTELKAVPDGKSNLINLTKKQKQKLHLHECCAHEGFTKLNSWICQGRFPHIHPSLANEPDPRCSIFSFGKARHKPHKSHVGQISKQHTAPGQGVSSDGMEARTVVSSP